MRHERKTKENIVNHFLKCSYRCISFIQIARKSKKHVEAEWGQEPINFTSKAETEGLDRDNLGTQSGHVWYEYFSAN